MSSKFRATAWTRCAKAAAACLVLATSTSVLAATASADASEGDARSCHPLTLDERGPLQRCVSIDSYAADLCRVIEDVADANALPPGFFARLIWQESRFDPNAVSPANAQGVAQFIRSTARIRGLENPFNPVEALSASATYLRELELRFGSLGLAAAAYNAGEGRVSGLLRRGGFGPAETENYVRIITGRALGDWLERKVERVDYRLDEAKPFRQACLALADSRRLARRFRTEGAWKPWGVEVASHFRQGVAQRMFSRVRAQYASLIGGETPIFVRARNRSMGARARVSVRIGRDSRAAALRLCQRLRAAGGVCRVARN